MGNSDGNTDHTPGCDANRDPISGAPGAHPVGTGVGAALGGVAAGAAVGTVAGPIGTIVGAAVGAVVGGFAGKDFAEVVDPTRDEDYWRSHYSERPYVAPGSSYDDFGPAYHFGADAVERYPGRTFDEVEPELARTWAARAGASTLPWEHARLAARDAWDRLKGNG